ncbi:DUF2264 domain-containing protein [Paenibacillus sp. GCM10023252]|uniref:DUF2264 domain-containing protein n=1 Tax=Paenibacillus sp. GCM10023252 TaxID=3252649 RepID=UPI00362329AE
MLHDKQESGEEVRSYWLHSMRTIVDPVYQSLRDRQLKELIPVHEGRKGRELFTCLEALGRSLCGMAPWLECPSIIGEEEKLRQEYAALAREAINAGTDPKSPDYMNFNEGEQPVVDAAFLAHALLRAPIELVEKLESGVKRNVIAALQSTRDIKPHHNNWLLFSGIVEAAIHRLGEKYDKMRVDYAIRQHEQWYKGDGAYGDGPSYHWDYYNSYVIQPMLVDLLDVFASDRSDWLSIQTNVLARAERYAAVQERLISPEGTFPPIGRSLAYRFGALQHLAQMSLQHRLPGELPPGQVRSALTAVIRRTMDMPGNFDSQGWLTIGLCGHQEEIGEPYISTGSLYLCSAVFLPLGLPPADDFWQQPSAPWTSVRAWGGQSFPIDHALR